MDEQPDPVPVRDAALPDTADAIVRLSTIAPFVRYLKARRLDVKPALKRWGLSEKAMNDPDRLVHAELIYGLVNDLALDAKDPHLGVHVGEDLPLQEWFFAKGVFREGATLAATLIRMIEAIPEFGQSVRHCLEIGSDLAVYRILRPYRTRNPAAQSDGLGTSVHLRFFDHIEGGWEPSSVKVLTRFPRAIPNGYRGVSVGGTEERALEVIFPTSWCHRTMSAVRNGPSTESRPKRVLSIVAALEAVVPRRLNDGTTDLKAAVARDLGLGVTDLESALRKHGTSFAREVRALRLRLASTALAETDAPISRIANDLGFSEAANFTRFFKGETAMAPREYRKSTQTRP